MKTYKTVAALAIVLASGAAVHAAPIFSETFDSGTAAASWTVNAAAGNNFSNFAFDYSAAGIPSAPNSTGGSTIGLKLEANNGGTSGAAFTGLSVSPTGLALAGNYKITADVWLNYNGPSPAGGSGSTQAGGMGLMTAGATPQWAGGAQDSIHFSATTDGNSSVDYRAYSPAAATGYLAPSGVFAAGTGTSPDARNNSNPYYAAPFPGSSAPAAQTLLFPQQTGTSLVGSQSFAWHLWTLEKNGSIVTWKIDNTLIATINSSNAGTLGGSNLLLNYFDTNATASTDANARALLFGLFDNVVVTPEPASLSTLALGSLLLGRRRK